MAWRVEYTKIEIVTVEIEQDQNTRAGQPFDGAPQHGPPRRLQTLTGSSGAVLEGPVVGSAPQHGPPRNPQTLTGSSGAVLEGPVVGGIYKGPTKLIVSNLDYGVSKLDMKNLFQEFGSLTETEVYYNASGHSLGTGEILFGSRSDALKALKKFNGYPLNGRPICIQFACDLNEVKILPLEPRRSVEGGSVCRNARNADGERRTFNTSASEPEYARASRKNIPTVEELDADLALYFAKKDT